MSVLKVRKIQDDSDEFTKKEQKQAPKWHIWFSKIGKWLNTQDMSYFK